MTPSWWDLSSQRQLRRLDGQKMLLGLYSPDRHPIRARNTCPLITNGLATTPKASQLHVTPQPPLPVGRVTLGTPQL